MTLKLGSLFSGYGGLDRAVHEAFGDVETRWVSDIESGPCKILAHRYPDAPNLGDITQIDWADVEPVDIIAGGSPCQDLSTLGYDAQWTTLRASTIGACHHRDRVFVLATRRGVPTDTLRRGTGWRGNEPRHGKGEQPDSATHQPDSPPRGAALKALPTVTTKDTDSPCESQLAKNTIPLNTLIDLLPTPDVRGDNRKTERFGNGGNNFHDIIAQARWGEYAPAIRRQEQAFGRAAPAPTTSNPRTGKPQLSARFAEWMMGLPDGWITDVPGITRAEAIRMCGNGVVPQQAAVALTFLATLIEENA